jgi:hypothetical protein
VTDDELVQAFETCTLEEFPHALHVRVAWCYLRRDDVSGSRAGEPTCSSIRRRLSTRT